MDPRIQLFVAPGGRVFLLWGNYLMKPEISKLKYETEISKGKG